MKFNHAETAHSLRKGSLIMIYDYIAIVTHVFTRRTITKGGDKCISMVLTFAHDTGSGTKRIHWPRSGLWNFHEDEPVVTLVL